MMIENVQVEYSEVSEDEGEELLYQVYELLLADTDIEQTEQSGPSPAPKIGYN